MDSMRRVRLAALPLLLALLVISPAWAGTDVFGIARLMPSKLPLQEWNSAHWAQGGKRAMDPSDSLDSTGWSRRRGNGTLMEIDGAGMLRMGGSQPRLYIQGTSARPVFFRDVEFTGYFRRVGNDGATGASGRLFPGGAAVPEGKWIGMKYLSYNVPGRADAVKLEAYVDTVSGGDAAKGPEWRKVAEIVDDGNWTAPPGACGYPGDTVISQGGGVVFIRNTDAAEAQYKMLSFREIDPTAPVVLENPSPRIRHTVRASWSPVLGELLLENLPTAGRVRVADLSGANLANAWCIAGGRCAAAVPAATQGAMVIAWQGRGPESRILLAPHILRGE